MLDRLLIGVLALATSLCLSLSVARAFDDGKYPDLNGQWLRVRLALPGQPPFDPPRIPGQPAEQIFRR